MSRCIACNTYLNSQDLFADDRQELCFNCLSTIFDDLPNKAAKKAQYKLDQMLLDHNIDLGDEPNE